MAVPRAALPGVACRSPWTRRAYRHCQPLTMVGVVHAAPSLTRGRRAAPTVSLFAFTVDLRDGMVVATFSL